MNRKLKCWKDAGLNPDDYSKAVADAMELYVEWHKGILKERYITAHCNPDFTGRRIDFIFEQSSI